MARFVEFETATRDWGERGSPWEGSGRLVAVNPSAVTYVMPGHGSKDMAVLYFATSVGGAGETQEACLYVWAKFGEVVLALRGDE